MNRSTYIVYYYSYWKPLNSSINSGRLLLLNIGTPLHTALAVNKFQNLFNNAISIYNFCKKSCLNIKKINLGIIPNMTDAIIQFRVFKLFKKLISFIIFTISMPTYWHFGIVMGVMQIFDGYISSLVTKISNHLLKNRVFTIGNISKPFYKGIKWIITITYT